VAYCLRNVLARSSDLRGVLHPFELSGSLEGGRVNFGRRREDASRLLSGNWVEETRQVRNSWSHITA
jgi:hypothetical protein